MDAVGSELEFRATGIASYEAPGFVSWSANFGLTLLESDGAETAELSLIGLAVHAISPVTGFLWS